MAILKPAEASTPTPELCRKHGVSKATFYKWRAKYGGMDAIYDGSAQRVRAEIVREAIEKNGCAI